MMKPELREILEVADDSENLERPPGFDWNAAIERVRVLKVQLERITRRKFVIDDNVQDATYFADLSLQRPGALPNHIDTVIGLQFSCFGNLFTTWSHSAAEQLPPTTIQELIETATEAGFRYVPAEELDEPYSGKHPYFLRSNWFDRFFNYI